MASICATVTTSMQRTRAFTSNSSRQTAVVHSHQNSSPPRTFAGRVSQPSLPRGMSHTIRTAASMQQRSQRPATSEPEPIDTASLEGLRSLTFDQRQALLFLAISSAALTTSDLTQASNLQFLAAVDRGQVISFLVNNPFVTLGVAVALYIIVPRILRLTVKFILLPASVAGVVYLVITNPTTSLGVVKTAFNYITANPAVTSIAILGVLALALSPYVLVIGSVVLLFSAASLPGPLKKLLPAPVVEAERQLDFVREKAKGPTAEAVSKLNSFKDSIFTSKPKALARAQLDSTKLLSAPSLALTEEKSKQQ